MAIDTLYLNQVKQGDTIPELTFTDATEVLDITGSTLKFQLYLGKKLIYTATSGSGITHVNAFTFAIDKIEQTTAFPRGTLHGDFQITFTTGDVQTWFNIEVEIVKEYTV